MAKLLSVSQLAGYIKGVFSDEILLHNLDVYGEISEFKVVGNKTFITIRENDYALPCVKFSVHEPIPLGVKVVLNGGISFYDKQGKISFNVRSVTLSGEGEQHIKLLKLKNRLIEEGLIGVQKPLPVYIKNIALITSETGAVMHDIISVNLARHNVNIYIFPARVQGGDAAADIVSALKTLQQYPEKFDCVVIARGGGSNLDLDIFNSESVARAVAACALPVISAVGHETDYTLCDLCASVRAGTPSIAAEIISAVNDSFLNRIKNNSVRLNNHAALLFQKNENKLYRLWNAVSSGAGLRLAVNNNELKNKIKRLNLAAITKIHKNFTSIKDSLNNLTAAVELKIAQNEQYFDKMQVLLSKNSPLKILSQGYAKIFKNNSEVLSVNTVAEGDKIKIVMSDGGFSATVNKKEA